MTVIEQINSDLKIAMKTKDKNVLTILRLVKSELVKKEQIKNSKKLTDNDVVSFLKKTVKKQTETANIYKQQDRLDLYNEEMEQVRILNKYIPEQISPENLYIEVKQILNDNNITDIKLFGKAMGLCMKELKDVSDGNTIKTIIQTILK